MKNTEKLRDKITQAFVSLGRKPEIARDIAFHLTDWDHNLDDLVRLYEQPDAFSEEEIRIIILQFLAHVPNHIAAAKKLAGMGPIEDVFKVGVLEEE
jgi:hypothetical protein